MKDRVVQTSSIFSSFQMVTSLGSFLPAEELPHFSVELPTHYQPHLLRVLPQQVPVIPCVVTTLVKHVLRKLAAPRCQYSGSQTTRVHVFKCVQAPSIRKELAGFGGWRVYTLLGKSSYTCDRTISTLLRSFSHSLICTGELVVFSFISVEQMMSGIWGMGCCAYLICNIL